MSDCATWIDTAANIAEALGTITASVIAATAYKNDRKSKIRERGEQAAHLRRDHAENFAIWIERTEAEPLVTHSLDAGVPVFDVLILITIVFDARIRYFFQRRELLAPGKYNLVFDIDPVRDEPQDIDWRAETRDCQGVLVACEFTDKRGVRWVRDGRGQLTEGSRISDLAATVN